MKIAVARETRQGESRVAMVPELVGKLTDLGYEVLVEPDAGIRADFDDELYLEAGATVTDDALAEADVVVGVNALSSDRARRLRDGAATMSFLPVNSSHELVADLRDLEHHRLRDGAGAAHLARPVDGRAVLAGPRVRLPLRDRGRRAAAPVLPAEHDGCRHRPAGPGRRARRRGGRTPGDRDRQAARRGRAGVRRARRRRRGDPLHGREVDRPRARDARGLGWLRPGDDRGPGRPAARAARAVHRQRGRADHHRRRARPDGADAGDRGHGRADEARLRGRRPRRRERRQRGGLGGRRDRPDRARAGLGWRQRAVADARPGLEALRPEHRQPADADDQRG